MSDNLRLDSDDDAITRGLRELHAAPEAESYWSELESRIMARIAGADTLWWTELGSWARPALAGAALLVLAAGLLLFQTSDEATQIAYEDVLATPTPISVAGTARPASLQGIHGERDETLRFLITY